MGLARFWLPLLKKIGLWCSGYDDWLRSVDWDFSIFPILRVGVMSRFVDASPPRNGELGTKKFVFGKLHKYVDNIKQKKNWKIFVLTNCEALKIWKQEWISNLPSQKYPPMWRFVDATPLKQSVPSLKKGYSCFSRPFPDSLKQKKTESDHFFPSNFQRSWQHELSLWESGSLRQCFMGIC